jgi:hypothetical protein
MRERSVAPLTTPLDHARRLIAAVDTLSIIRTTPIPRESRRQFISRLEQVARDAAKNIFSTPGDVEEARKLVADRIDHDANESLRTGNSSLGNRGTTLSVYFDAGERFTSLMAKAA